MSLRADADERRLAKHARYNASAKGRARDQRYEAKHPERKERWAPLAYRREPAIGAPSNASPWSDSGRQPLMQAHQQDKEPETELEPG